MLGGWVNPHRDQQTIPQGQTSRPPKYFSTPTAKARPDQAALATSAEERGATHRARPRSHCASWPLQDILSLQRVYARVHHPLIAPPPIYNAHTLTILLHDHCAINDPYPTRPVCAIPRTILAMAINNARRQLSPGL